VSAPFAPGSVSLRLYPHDGLPAAGIVDELCAQAALGAEHGFDGVMTSEHHAGFHGYLPNPLQAAGWCLEEMTSGWAAPSPLLLPLRPAALVAEEVAWLAARFPGRVGLGVASGALKDDFEVMGLTMHDLAARFADALEEVAAILAGRDLRGLAGDAAVQECVDHPVPVVSAAMGFTAARLGVGILFDSLSTPERCRELSDAYRTAGGTAPCVIIRRAWIGEPPRGRVDDQLDVYRSYSTRAAQTRWGRDELVCGTDGTVIAAELADATRRAGADAVNLRVHVPGVEPEEARDQITRLGDAVVEPLRRELKATVSLPGGYTPGRANL
jgi:alkanesulfonate monooxygenase SsuD/methylene tetrahydromethanopterin reductase-like flavin-dependent oxidoreductase (luciferase family)